MDLINKALEFEKQKRRSLTTSDRVKISREAKALILGLNEIYKEKKRCQNHGHYETAYCHKTKN